MKEKGKQSIRLDKLLGQEGLGTRSDLKKAIRAGHAAVNGIREKDPGRQITASDEVFFRGKKVGRAQFVYYMLHKPAGVITAAQDSRDRTVLDLLRQGGAAPVPQADGSVPDPEPAENAPDPEKNGPGPGPDGTAPVLRRGLFPVGRLDRDTEGLLLITDDGQLAHRLLSPKKHVDKTYYAIVSGMVTHEDIAQFAQGLSVGACDPAAEGASDSFTALPALLRVVERPGQGAFESAADAGPAVSEGTQAVHPVKSAAAPPWTDRPETDALRLLLPADPAAVLLSGATEYTQVLVTIREGKYHQIKRMFAAVGKEVLYLKRLSMGPLWLDPALGPGEFRELTTEEKERICAVRAARNI